MSEIYRILEYELEPLIDSKEFQLIENNLKDCFLPSYLDYVVCKECPEHCVRDVFKNGGKIYFECPTGYIELREEVDSSKLERYKFKPEILFQKIAEINNIFYDNKNINSKVILFGKKEVQKSYYKFFYATQVFTNKELNDEVIYMIKSWLQPTEKALIFTPQSLNLQNKDFDFLNQNNCRLLELPKLLDNYLIIEELNDFEPENIKELSKRYPLVIRSAKDSYLFGHRLDLYLKPFQLLRFLASISQQSIHKDECIDHLWKDQTKDIDYNKQLYNHRSSINNAFKKAGIPKSNYNNIIIVKDEYFRLNLDASDIYIKK